MKNPYTPVSYDHRETIHDAIQSKKEGKVFFFDSNNQVNDLPGFIQSLDELPGKGLFITMDSGAQIRIDRIITLFGIPGAAYDEYDAFGRTCLDCTGGYPL